MPKTTEQSRVEGIAADPCCFWQKLLSNIYIILIDFNACDFHTALVITIASMCCHITEYADTSAEIDEFDVVFVIERDMQPKVTGQSVRCKKGSCCTIDMVGVFAVVIKNKACVGFAQLHCSNFTAFS